jgi:hypothetical protein
MVLVCHLPGRQIHSLLELVQGLHSSMNGSNSLKQARTQKTQFLCGQFKEAVHIARACIDDALIHAESRPGPSGGAPQSSLLAAEGSAVYLEQQWDLESARGSGGPGLSEPLCAAAGQTFSQSLAEDAACQQGGEVKKSVTDMVPPELHEFLDVFDKGCSERLPVHKPHDLAIELEEGTTLPPTGKLY